MCAASYIGEILLVNERGNASLYNKSRKAGADHSRLTPLCLPKRRHRATI
jgi:hypothetical protein